jgi:uncharacterized protein YcbK (DUF882 family)
MGDLSPHFSTSEMACHDCGRMVLDPGLIPALEALRSLGPEPIIVDDAYRCPEHNSSVGGVQDSQHIYGKAADIQIVGLTLQQMYDRAIQIPAFANGGIGVYSRPNFMHVDIRDGIARWARVDGEYVGIDQLVTV